MAWWNWSLTAASNANADSTINYSEGMSPSSVNDSCRAVMARSAEFRDLISGKLVTTGTGTALVLASGQNPVFDTTAHMDGQMFGFVPNVTNTGAVTLAVDGLTAKPIRSQTGSSGNLGAGVLIVGTPYIVTYYDTAGEFILHGFVGQPFSVPIGAIIPYCGTTAPNTNFVLPFGQAISRTTYAAYFTMVGTTFGVGDGTTTFNVPDLRGRSIFGVDNMGGSTAGRVTNAGSGIVGTTLGAAGGVESVVLDITMIPPHTHTPTLTDPGHKHTVPDSSSASMQNNITNVKLPFGSTDTSISTTGITISNANTGGGLLHTNMPPTMMLNMILRIQ